MLDVVGHTHKQAGAAADDGGRRTPPPRRTEPVTARPLSPGHYSREYRVECQALRDGHVSDIDKNRAKEGTRAPWWGAKNQKDANEAYDHNAWRWRRHGATNSRPRPKVTPLRTTEPRTEPTTTPGGGAAGGNLLTWVKQRRPKGPRSPWIWHTIS